MRCARVWIVKLRVDRISKLVLLLNVSFYAANYIDFFYYKVIRMMVFLRRKIMFVLFCGHKQCSFVFFKSIGWQRDCLAELVTCKLYGWPGGVWHCVFFSAKWTRWWWWWRCKSKSVQTYYKLIMFVYLCVRTYTRAYRIEARQRLK